MAFFTALIVTVLLLGSQPRPVQAVGYALTDNWVGDSFFDAFSWQKIPDPTQGRVNYLSQPESRSLNLSYASDSNFVLKSDSTAVLRANGPGRNSNRIMSNKQYGHNTVLVADINHMPVGCGTWPALWTAEVPDWPIFGEIDILEGVNNRAPNQMTLHTTAGCAMPASRPESGTPIANDCNWEVNFNTGCGVDDSRANSYSTGFNNARGGWYAMERTAHFIKMWFWSRDDAGVPEDVRNPGQPIINTDGWGLPSAYFPDTSCDIPSHFGAHNVIINLTFCGDWAGQQAIYAGDGCPGTCVDYVNNNPAAFAGAYWDIAAIRMYGLN